MTASSPFSVLPLKKKNLLAKWFSVGPDENAFIELNNLLATRPLLEIQGKDVAAIIETYQVDITRHFKDKVVQLYLTYFQSCIVDYTLGEEENRSLLHLKKLLLLTDADIDPGTMDIAGGVVTQAWKDTLADGRLTPEEEEKINKLVAATRLPEATAKEISALTRELHYRQYLLACMEDRRLTPEEDAELKAISQSLSITPQFDDAMLSTLERYRLLYQLENGPLPEISCDINLLANEACHFTCAASWYEYRTVTHRVNYGGPAVSIRLMKGVYYRAGSMRVQPVRSEQLQLIDSGTLYLTNKRVIFVGSNKAKTIKYDKIMTLTPYSDGVELIKDAGKSPTITVNGNDAELMNLTLVRLISDDHS